MKAVINRGDGEFYVKDWILEEFGLDESFELSRNNTKLIRILETHGCENCGCDGLTIVEVPPNATDWYIESYGRRNEVLVYVDSDGNKHKV